jgi:hypothetical protein
VPLDINSASSRHLARYPCFALGVCNDVEETPSRHTSLPHSGPEPPGPPSAAGFRSEVMDPHIAVPHGVAIGANFSGALNARICTDKRFLDSGIMEKK